MVGLAQFLYHNRIGKTFPGIKSFFEKVHEAEGRLPICCAGFCWGGKQLFLLSHKENVDHGGKPLICAGFAGHPSMLTVPGDIEMCEVPISIALGERDDQITAQIAEKIHTLIKAKPEATRGEIKVYENAAHGFCVRADVEFPNVEKQALEAEDQCISWLNSHLLNNATF